MQAHFIYDVRTYTITKVSDIVVQQWRIQEGGELGFNPTLSMYKWLIGFMNPPLACLLKLPDEVHSILAL